MSQATVRIHGELNDFVDRRMREQAIERQFAGRVSVKDLIESQGVPHPEVAAIVVGGRGVDFSYIIQDGDAIDVFPASLLGRVAAPVALRPAPPVPARFVLDAHLGQLAAYCRMLGFDTLYRNDYDDDELAVISSAEGRILLTRDRGLLKRGIVTFGYYVRHTDPQRQVAEVLGRYDLAGAIAPLRRCIRCNGGLRAVAKEQIAERLSPKTRAFFTEFSVCQACDQIYWKGSHYEKMRAFIDGVLGDSSQPVCE